MRRLFSCRLKKFWTDFHADKSGIAVAYIGIAIPVLIGFSLLAIDVGRMSTLQSSLQHGADALALAGAGELDRNTDAITRSERAITNLITTNTGLFSTAPVTINRADVSTCYLTNLPPNDATAAGLDTGAVAPFTCGAAADQASYVQVKVTPANFTTVFPATFLGASSNSSTTTAQAVAGGTNTGVCTYTPVFICNPFEPSLNTDNNSDFGFAQFFSTAANRRRMMAFVNAGTNSPGNWGFLSPPTGNGAPPLADSIGLKNPQTCFAQPGVSTKTGQTTGPLVAAFGARFDIGATSTYPPGTNVRKGYDTTFNGKSGKCSTQTAGTDMTKFMGLPRDSCLPTSASPNNTCPSISSPISGGATTTSIGNGDWGNPAGASAKVSPQTPVTNPSFGQYWYVNFGTTLAPLDSNNVRYSNTNLPSRYDIYTYEKTHNAFGAIDTNTATNLVSNPSAGKETGKSVCDGTYSTDTPDRRLLYVAVLNCKAVNLAPGSTGGPYVPVEYANIFITEPAINFSPKIYLYGEIAKVYSPGDNSGAVHDLVQLYR